MSKCGTGEKSLRAAGVLLCPTVPQASSAVTPIRRVYRGGGLDDIPCRRDFYKTWRQDKRSFRTGVMRLLSCSQDVEAY